MRFLSLIRYKIAKRRVRLRQQIHPEYVPTEKEEKTIKIIQTLIRDEESVLMVAPITGKLYIKNDKLSMVIVMDDIYIKLLNNKSNSYHDIIVHYEVALKLQRNFKNVLETRMNIMEGEMIEGAINNLDYISKNIVESEYGTNNTKYRDKRREDAAIA